MEVGRAAAEFAIVLAITEENGPVYIGGAATFTWYRELLLAMAAATSAQRWHQQTQHSGAPGMKTRAEKWRLALQQPRSRYFWRVQRKIARYISAVRRHLPASGHDRCNFSAKVAPTHPAQWRTWNENQSRKVEVGRAAAEVAILLAITEEKCRVYIGGAANGAGWSCG